MDPARTIASPDLLPDDAPSEHELRVLRERAQAAFEQQRENAQRLEGRLDECLARVADGISAARGEGDAQCEQLAAQLEEVRAALADSERERQELITESQSLRDELAKAGDARADAEARLAEAAQDSEVQEKFELALADVQKHRQRIDELEHELESRPESDGADTAEVLRLREEREELQARVERLEEGAKQREADADTDPDTADLQRRFELAVEDVRELRREKEELEQRLQTMVGAGFVDDGAQDWESQKRRLLANLEGESGEVSPERAEERATMEGTIKITDEVVAKKDRELEELREQLTAAQDAAAQQPETAPLDDDERLEAERARLAQLEEAWREKLREAELEVSVERAKIAREKAELSDLRVDLEAMRDSLANAPSAASGEPASRRQSNWLRKLGLGGDE